jgi:uncharacterized repeat protein (TIGR03843 family)
VVAEGDLELLGLLPRSSNYAFLARATIADDEALVVYKPRRGETPLWDFPDGTLCNREVAAYVVARRLGWPNVPPTVLRDGPEGEGSVQSFVDFDPNEHYFTMAEAGRFLDEFRRIALFDVVANNADRKAGHCLLGRDGRIHVIDHGVCFAEEEKLRTVIWEFVGEPIPSSELVDLRRLTKGFATLRGELAHLLSERELVALRDRLEAVVRAERFPEPGEDRPYPWPPV